MLFRSDVGKTLQLDFLLRHALTAQRLAGVGLKLLISVVDLCKIHLFGPLQKRSQIILTDLYLELAKGRGKTRILRDQDLGDLQLPRRFRRMQGAATAEGKQGKLPWIIAALDGDEPGRVGNIGIGDAKDTVGRFFYAHAKKIRNFFP